MIRRCYLVYRGGDIINYFSGLAAYLGGCGGGGGTNTETEYEKMIDERYPSF